MLEEGEKVLNLKTSPQQGLDMSQPSDRQFTDS